MKNTILNRAPEGIHSREGWTVITVTGKGFGRYYLHNQLHGIGNRCRKGLQIYLLIVLINVPIRKKMRPRNNKYINSFDGSIPVIILSTTESGGMDTYLAATEDTMIRAKTADQVIMLLNSFI
jgi:hypothetical protein